MKENFDLLVLDLPAAGTKAWLIVEHLTLKDLNCRGEVPTSDGVVRISLCDTRNGDNPVSVYELMLDADDDPEANEAHAWARCWASGFVVGARYAGVDLGFVIRPPAMNIPSNPRR